MFRAASPEAVWHLLLDYPNHARLYPGVVSAQVLEDAGARLASYLEQAPPARTVLPLRSRAAD